MNPNQSTTITDSDSNPSDYKTCKKCDKLAVHEVHGTWLCHACYREDFPRPMAKEERENEIISCAIEYYGEPAQVLKCIEELAGLGKELATRLDSNSDAQAVNSFIYMAVCFDDVIDECKAFGNDDVYTIADDINNTEVIVSKLADVAITTRQMLKMFTTPEEFEKVKQAKLNRLVERMNGDDK